MQVFTKFDLEFFDQHGYVIARNVVPQANLDAVIAAIWEFLGMDPHNPDDWYRPPHSPGGMIELYQHQALWDNRQYPRVHQAFSEIFGTPKLWVSEDRVSMKPPSNAKYPAYDYKGFTHWDVDTSRMPLPFEVQGVLCLTDTTADMGGFQCVPGFHKNLAEWIAAQPADRDPWAPNLAALPAGMKVVPIPANAGDLIIWNTLLAHGNGHNVSSRPRLAQYITMQPVGDDAERRQRIARWRNRQKPKGDWAPGDPRRLEELHGKTAELSELGRKLLGIDDW
jgi:ectoine hydroxylase-related dioxygenase (phytanoyl-CoA dioxygenase family)